MIQPSHPGNPSEMAALYASGAMTDDERRKFEAHLGEGCPTCAAALAEYDDVVLHLAEGVAPQAPPPQIAARLLARISGAEAATEHVEAAEPREAATLWVRRADEGQWTDTPYWGVQVRTLYVDKRRRQFTSLVRMAPGSSYPAHSHHEAEECLVLEGDLRFGQHVLHGGDFLRTGPGYEQVMQTTEGGCLLYLTSPFE